LDEDLKVVLNTIFQLEGTDDDNEGEEAPPLEESPKDPEYRTWNAIMTPQKQYLLRGTPEDPEHNWFEFRTTTGS
jgi:hypothetical protein